MGCRISDPSRTPGQQQQPSVPAGRRWSGGVSGQATAAPTNRPGAPRGLSSKPDAQQLPAIMPRRSLAEVLLTDQRSNAAVPTQCQEHKECRRGQAGQDRGESAASGARSFMIWETFSRYARKTLPHTKSLPDHEPGIGIIARNARAGSSGPALPRAQAQPPVPHYHATAPAPPPSSRQPSSPLTPPLTSTHEPKSSPAASP